jgi:putative membrane protein
MTHLLIAWLILTLGILAAAKVVPGVRVPNFRDAMIAAAVFGILDVLLAKALFIIFGVVTLGLGFLFFFITFWVINALLLKLTDVLTDRLTINGFGSALLAALVISVVGALGHLVIRLA